MVRTYVVLLSLVLGFCPHDVFGAQRQKKPEPHVTPVLPAEAAWQITLPFSATAGGAMDDARVYVPLAGEHFSAIDRETGQMAWTVDIESDWPPLVRDGVVYLAASDELHALDAATGNRRWRVPLGRGAMAPMVMTQQALIVLVVPDEVWAFNPSDGSVLWTTPLGGPGGRVSMSVNETGVYVALADRLVRVTPSDGSLGWQQKLPGEIASLAVARDRVLAGSTSNEVYAFEPDRGRLAWKFRFGGDVVGIAANAEHVFVVSLDNLVRALNRSNGNQIWKRALATRPGAAPQVFDGVVAVAGAESVATFNSRSGVPIGTFEAADLLQGQPLVDPTPSPFAVSVLAIMRDGRAVGLRPVEMLFREKPIEPFAALPGRPLQKELSPLPGAPTPRDENSGRPEQRRRAPAAASPRDGALLP